MIILTLRYQEKRRSRTAETEEDSKDFCINSFLLKIEPDILSSQLISNVHKILFYSLENGTQQRRSVSLSAWTISDRFSGITAIIIIVNKEVNTHGRKNI